MIPAFIRHRGKRSYLLLREELWYSQGIVWDVVHDIVSAFGGFSC